MNAELAGRTESNYFDIRRSMEELGVVSIEELIRFNEHAAVLPWPRGAFLIGIDLIFKYSMI